MITFKHTVIDSHGLHARPAAMIAQTCVNFKSSVTISYGEKRADGNNVLAILSLGVKQGEEITITIDGSDEQEAYEKILHEINTKFGRVDTPDCLKIAFFGTKSYDKKFFAELAEDKGQGTYNVDITYFQTRLTPETATLAKGFEAVCIFVNDECGKEIVDTLYECGVKLILLRCAGFNNVDLNECAKLGITVLRVPAYSPYAVAEHAMAIVQTANRRLHRSYNKVKENNFDLTGLLGLDLHNKVAGIVGTGKIGICMANICKGYGMTVLGWDAYPNKALEESGLLTYVSKEELFKRADLISLHAPLIMGEGGTYHLIDKDSIALMKDTAMIVNTARGALIDAEALIDALKAGKFNAVALDVYEGEDTNVYTNLSDDIVTNDITGRLLMFPQVVITSHQAFFTREALQAIAIVTMENARNYACGKDYGASEVKAQ
ncbi:MAG: fused HPr family phosphocarrier protein/2-hydroxyacid dehydrogenase [Erysipelotrichaceae bacterium]|nr:fused HPr family phosphocarrier protein/2-hydroxyacid dehydrogenase [Erysipelotrichaceae bacterium]